MTQAIIFVNCDANDQEAIRDFVKEIEGVHEAHLTDGLYDLILKAHAESEEELREDVIRKIRSTGGIRSTTTMIVFKQDVSAGDMAIGGQKPLQPMSRASMQAGQ